MESQYQGAVSRSPLRHRTLRRSISAEPGASPLASAPYSSTRRLARPGRSLTEHFSLTHQESPSAGAEELDVARRRRAGSSGTLQLCYIKEEVEFTHARSHQQPYSDRTPNLPLCLEYRSRTGDTYQDAGSTNSPDAPLHRHHRYIKQIDSDHVHILPKEKKQKLDNERKMRHEKALTMLGKVLRKIGKAILWFLVITASLMLLVIGISTFLVYQEAMCEQRRNAKLPLHELHEQLTKNVVGQKIAIETIINNLRTFTLSKTDSPLVLWFAGWSGSGKTHTINILRSALSEACEVQSILPSLLPRQATQLDRDVFALTHRLDSCSFNLIIIDDWDGETRLPIVVLEKLLANLYQEKASGHSKGRVVVVLSGTRGSEEVGRHFLELRHHEPGTNPSEQHFINLSKSLQATHELNSITKHVVLVPFLPLDASHVKVCIKTELLRMQREEVLVVEEELEKVTQQVLARLQLLPGNHPPLVAQGCKRVPALLALLLSGVPEGL